MGWDAWVAVGAVGGSLALLALTRLGPEIILLGALALLVVLGIAPAAELLAGFSNTGLLTIGALFIVVAGMQETGTFWVISRHLLGTKSSLRAAQARLIFPVAGFSAFLNNIPLVAMLTPVATDWARQRRIPPSKLLLLLSYAAILGGMCTILGTSTNLLLHGLHLADSGEALGMFSITPIGLPVALAGLLFLLFFGARMLPSRSSFNMGPADPREYVLEMVVEPGSPLVGQRIEDAGLRHLPGLYLAEIERDSEVVAAVGPSEILQAGDHLAFVGILESVVDLQKIRGLSPATDQRFKLEGVDGQRQLFEAVVSHTAPLIGRTIREARFRSDYNGAVLAVSRNGERLHGKIGDIVLQPGDTLLIEAHPTFQERHGQSRDFYLVSRIDGYQPPRHDRAWIAIGIILSMVLLAATGALTMLQASWAAAAAMILTRCATAGQATRVIDYKVLLSIAAAIGIAGALRSTGAAEAIAGAAFGFAAANPVLLIAAVYVLTALFTELVTNNAAAVLIYPLAAAAAAASGIPFEPVLFAIMIASSAAFATPIGYQTNLIVYGPGGYRFGDFLRIGIPLQLVVAATAIALLASRL